MSFSVYFVLLNAITLVLYWVNARAVRIRGHQAFRFPDGVLLLAGFLGGTLAAALAQLILRYKIRKRAFLIEFATVTILQLSIVHWLIAFRPDLINHWLADLGKLVAMTIAA